MSPQNKIYSRRDFLKTAGAIGVGSIIYPTESLSINSTALKEANTDNIFVPKRPFGRSRIAVPILALGAAFNTMSRQLILKQAFKMGVTYWETAEEYGSGYCEKGIGKYFLKNPMDREKVFLVTKTRSFASDTMTKALDASLQRLNTSYIDLYLWHAVCSGGELELLWDKEARIWVERMKGEGKIRLFGFSTHENMEECMLKAVGLRGFDGIQMSYNFRLMNTDKMREAVEACVKAGIGLTAMKSVAMVRGGSIDPPELSDEESDLMNRIGEGLLKQGFTDIQARLMAVWSNPHIASITVLMPNMTILKSNVAAALNRNKISNQDLILMNQYAKITGSKYCMGCSKICESLKMDKIPISDVLRYMMYSHNYGEPDRARKLYKTIPGDIRYRIPYVDYSAAEEKCPQKIPIGRFMRKAAMELA